MTFLISRSLAMSAMCPHRTPWLASTSSSNAKKGAHQQHASTASQQQRVCAMQNAKWQAGRCVLDAVPDTVRVQDVINDSLLNKPHGFPRLYFTDGTFPGELPEGVTCQDDLPGHNTFSRLLLILVTESLAANNINGSDNQSSICWPCFAEAVLDKSCPVTHKPH